MPKLEYATLIRLSSTQAVRFSGIRGITQSADELVEQCLSDYDLDGWADGAPRLDS